MSHASSILSAGTPAPFVIDAEGMIHRSYLSPVGINPGADGILEALESLQVATHAPASRGPS